mmetsp:Transcript_23256/g.59294  ORF Transcript_23256/g.59294 Transcript_23256/m.59294 type:complete len:277 (-) Transcript_23256:551-1381(-)
MERKPEALALPLAMSRAGEEIWVLKVPKFLASHLQGGHLVNETLGTVKPTAAASSSTAASSGTPSFTLTLEGSKIPEGMPREYELNFSATPPATYVFSHGLEDGAAAASQVGAAAAVKDLQHEGRVVAKGEIRPSAINDDYKSLVRERFLRADEKSAQMAIIADDSQVDRQALDHNKVKRDERLAKQKRGEKRELASNKRARSAPLSKQELREKVLQLFATQEYWGKPQLQAAIGSSEGLGACLTELCVKILKRGPNYGDYELKPELSGKAGASRT